MMRYMYFICIFFSSFCVETDRETDGDRVYTADKTDVLYEKLVMLQMQFHQEL